MALRFAVGWAGASSGKNFNTLSSTLSLPSATARPTAVEVKLLLSEYSECRASRRYGAHQPSATTWPCRTSMKLCSESILSAASTNANTADDETPCVSGSLRGKSAARELAQTKHSRQVRLDLFMGFQNPCKRVLRRGELKAPA